MPPSKITPDRERYLCAHYEAGQRCANLGTMTSNTQGDPKGGPHPGPWYCHKHWGPLAGAHGVDPLAKLRLKEAVAKAFGPKLVDPEELAERAAIQAEGEPF